MAEPNQKTVISIPSISTSIGKIRAYLHLSRSRRWKNYCIGQTLQILGAYRQTGASFYWAATDCDDYRWSTQTDFL